MKWSVGTKIGAGFALALLILIAIGITAYRSTVTLIANSEKVAHTHKVISQLENVLSLMKDIQSGQRGYVITGEDPYLESYQVAVNTIDQEIKNIRELTADMPSQQRRFDTLETLIRSRIAFAREVIDARRNKGFEPARQLTATGTGKKEMDEIRRSVSEMQGEENELLKQRSEAAAASARNTILIIMWGIPLGIVLLALIGFLITRNISAPLKELSYAAENIAVGDLSVQIPSNNRSDEVGQLAKAFTKMTQSLQNMAESAKRIASGDLTAAVHPQSDRDILGNAFSTMSTNLREGTHELMEATHVLAASVNQILVTTQQFAASSAETATAVSQTTTTIEEVRQTAQVSSEKAKNVSEGAQKAAHTSQSGKKSMTDSIEVMKRIKQQMEAIAESIVRLSEQSQSIGELIAIVNDLAERSNLLAVNAAIEAAKAGEQGRGFAVVAQEVKSLAEQSKQATSQVRSILSDIQNATNAAVMATEQGSKAVDNGVKQSTEAMAAIMTITENISESANAAVQIAASNHQQLIGVDQVAQAMENINQSVSQNTASTRELETSAHNLHDLGQKLKVLIDRYKV